MKLRRISDIPGILKSVYRYPQSIPEMDLTQIEQGSSNLGTIGQKIWKSPGQKKLVKSNKSISRIFFTKFHFLLFLKWPKINFWARKKFKTEYFPWKLKFYLIFTENIQHKNSWKWFIWVHEFFCLDILKFSGLLW